MQATAVASSGRVAPRGGDDVGSRGKFGRAAVGVRVRLIVLSSNWLWLCLAAPASAAGNDPRACHGLRRAWLAGGRTFGALFWSVAPGRSVRLHE